MVHRQKSIQVQTIISIATHDKYQLSKHSFTRTCKQGPHRSGSGDCPCTV